MPLSDSRGLNLAMGFFDGVHLGHKKVIESAIVAKSEISGVLTFEQHPHSVITGQAPTALISAEDKISIISNMGIDCLYMLDFVSVRDMPAADFIALLKGKLDLKSISCGYNFHLGADRADVNMLAKICAQNRITLKISEAVEYEGIPVSSTRIREAVQSGDMALVSGMLGRPYGFLLKVEHGDQRGRELGFPTINQQLPKGVAVPRHGVYISMVNTGDSWYPGITNIGLRPTYSVLSPLAETHILGYSGNLYGKQVEVRLFDFLREERKFASTEELVETVMGNIGQAEKWYKDRVKGAD